MTKVILDGQINYKFQFIITLGAAGAAAASAIFQTLKKFEIWRCVEKIRSARSCSCGSQLQTASQQQYIYSTGEPSRDWRTINAASFSQKKFCTCLLTLMQIFLTKSIYFLKFDGFRWKQTSQAFIWCMICKDFLGFID